MNRVVRAVGLLVDPVPAEMAPVSQVRTFTISSKSLDREGDIMEPSGCMANDYLRNPVVLWSHDYTALPVGKASSLTIRPADIVSDVEFAPTTFAQEVKGLVDGGFINGASIGFLPAEGGTEPIMDDQGRQTGTRYTRWHLLEWSLVPVPSNQDALAHLFAEARTKGLSVETLEYAVRRATTKPGIDETAHEFRYRLHDPDGFQADSFRRITVKHDPPRVFGVIGRPTGSDKTKLQSLAFPKDDGWDREQVRAWVAAHPDIGKSIDGGAEVTIGMEKAAGDWKVGGARGLPLNEDRTWDASAAVGRIRAWAGGDDKEKIDWGKYRKAFIVNNGAEEFGGVKLPFADVIEGRLVAIRRGLVAARIVLSGGRGGVDIGGAESAAKAFVDRYLGAADEDGKGMLGELERAWSREDVYRNALVDAALGIPVEKTGAVLSRANRERLQAAQRHLSDAEEANGQCAAHLRSVLDAHDAADALHSKILDRFTDADEMVRSLIGIRSAGGDATSEVGIQAVEARILKDAGEPGPQAGPGGNPIPAPPLGSSVGRDEYGGGASDPDALRRVHRVIKALHRLVKEMTDPMYKASRAREKAALTHEHVGEQIPAASALLKDVLNAAGTGDWHDEEVTPGPDDTAETGSTGKGIVVIKEAVNATASPDKGHSIEPIVQLDIDPSTLKQMLRDTLADELKAVLGRVT